MKTTLQPARVGFLVYIVLLPLSILFMVLMQGDEFCGMFAVLLTLPWSLAVIVLPFIFPKNDQGILPGLLIVLVSGGINLALLWKAMARARAALRV